MPCFNCGLKHEEQLFARARKQYSSEVDIVDFLKRIRRLEAFKVQMHNNYELGIDEF